MGGVDAKSSPGDDAGSEADVGGLVSDLPRPDLQVESCDDVIAVLDHVGHAARASDSFVPAAVLNTMLP